MIKFEQRGDFKNTFKFLEGMKERRYLRNLNQLAQRGVDALAQATPRDTGLTADSWYYEIHDNGRYVIISWRNRNTANGIPIAVLLQYGHGTATGGYVVGLDYINPAMRPIFDKIAADAWAEVTRL